MKYANAFVVFGSLSALLILNPRVSAAQAFSEQKLRQACVTLQQTPFAAEELQTLAETSRLATNSPALRSRAMAAYSLAFLMQGNTSAFERALSVIRTTSPDALPLIQVTREDCFAMCQNCVGSGNKTTLCPTCMGTGKCKSCLGLGTKDTAACPACKGKSGCGMCSGKKRIKTPCPACNGSAFTFKPKESIRNNFTALLSDMIARCEDNARYAEQLQLATKETDHAKRIAILRPLLQDFSHRKDLGTALTMMELAVNAQRSEESWLRAKDTREREEREKASLLRLRDVRSRDLNAAVAQILTYLKEHPDRASDLELKDLFDELVARRNRATRARKIITGALVLVGTLLLITVLKPLLFRKKPGRASPCPGMDKIDKSQFTDPLKLNAQESHARNKIQAEQITRPEGAPRKENAQPANEPSDPPEKNI